MADYDFHQLSPHDFEKMARDLLQADWSVTLESFKAGKDGGTDLRYAQGGAHTVVQCKHYVRTGLAGLLRDLREEAAKVRKLQPKRYLLATSVPLSPANKAEIVEIIGADILQTSDILGQEDLNNRLAQHPEVERRHYKLWLASRAVLDRVLNNAVITQSEFKVQKVYAEIRRYVQSNAFPQALETLDRDRVVILAGPPGVGKTTLASLLLYEHLEKGYNAIIMQRDIQEGQKLLQEGERQIFYFDDFMGSTFLGDRGSAFNRNEDRAILDFVAMVRASPTARLVLTTREHILSQALALSERMRHSGIGDHRVVLRMADYTFGQRAEILYNHLYFSNLPSEYQDELLRDDFYFWIIKHEKFNPRLIEWLSTYRRVRAVDVRTYRAFIRDLLQDSSEIWRHAYEHEISDAGRSFLLALFTLGGKAGGGLLEPAFTTLHRVRAERYGYQRRPEDFRAAFRELAGAFVKPVSAHSIEVLDPSVLDLLNAVVRAATENAVDMILGSATFGQIDRVWSFANAMHSQDVMSALVREADLLADAIAPRLHDDRRVDMGGGAVGYRGATFERRLAVLVSMADRLRRPNILALVNPLLDRLIEEWRTETVNITDGVDILRALQAAAWPPVANMSDLQRAVSKALIGEAATGCRSDELRELISVLPLEDDADGEIMNALRRGFEKYRLLYFSDELRECRSTEQFDGLLGDLKWFETSLGVDIKQQVDRTEETKAEFEEHQEAYADHMEDEWKERWHNERASEGSVRDMFGSLRSDRN